MNKLSAWFAKNKKLALAAGGAGAVGLGLYARSHKKAAGPALGSVQPKSTVIAPATYDSTSSDLYNSIEPLIEGLQRQITSLGQQVATPVAGVAPTVAAPAPAPAPSPAAPPPPAPAPVVPQTVMSAPAIVGLLPPPPDPSAPSVTYRVLDPTYGQLAVTTGAYPSIYGGSAEQVNALVDPSAPGGTWNMWNSPNYSW